MSHVTTQNIQNIEVQTEREGVMWSRTRIRNRTLPPPTRWDLHALENLIMKLETDSYAHQKHKFPQYFLLFQEFILNNHQVSGDKPF